MPDSRYDVVVVGGGTAGLAAYRAVVAKGKSALLIEKNSRITTTCAQFGCMPSKLLIAAAKSVKNIKSASKFGVNVNDFSIDNTALLGRVRSERDRFVGFVERGAANLNKIHGSPYFVDKNTLKINDKLIHADNFIIATGTSVRVPEVFKDVPGVLTNESVFEISELPKKLLVVGAGVIGLELGSAFSNLGVSVTLVNNIESILGLNDRVKASVKSSLMSRLTYLDNANVTQVSQLEDGTYSVIINSQHYVFDKILLAAGRTPNLADLGLEKVWPNINFLKTMNPNTHHIEGTPLYFAGDVDGMRPLLHEAAFYGKNVGEYVATGKRSQENDMAKMAIIFSDPQIMMVGDSYRESDHFLGFVDFSDQGRSRVDGINEGVLEVYFDKNTHALKGAQMSGPSAEHLAHTLAWSVEMGATLEKLLSMPFYHPVVEEGLRTAIKDAASKV